MDTYSRRAYLCCDALEDYVSQNRSRLRFVVERRCRSLSELDVAQQTVVNAIDVAVHFAHDSVERRQLAHRRN